MTWSELEVYFLQTYTSMYFFVDPLFQQNVVLEIYVYMYLKGFRIGLTNIYDDLLSTAVFSTALDDPRLKMIAIRTEQKKGQFILWQVFLASNCYQTQWSM